MLRLPRLGLLPPDRAAEGRGNGPPIHLLAATLADRQRVAATLADAFADDPALNWIFPHAAVRPARLRAFFDLILRAETDPGLTMLSSDGGSAAIWRSPDAWRTPTGAMLRLAPRLIATFGTALLRALRLQAEMERHHPSEPHWYLAFVGVRRDAQRKGLGGKVIRAGLARADADGLPCALETATESNLPIYRALGFEITDRLSVAGAPQFWAMWRPATRT